MTYLATTGRRDDAPAPPPTGGGAGRRIPATVLALGTVSLVTDVSSEMVTAVLPLYLVLGLGLSPLQFGFLDGLFNAASAVVRLIGGHAADRGGRHKRIAGIGYLLSACSRLGLLLAGGATAGLATALAADRVGKGIRTAPRDALISLSGPPETLGRSFGVHRAMDTTGALLGPLVAFTVLWATADAYDAVFVVSFCIGLLGVLVLLLYVPGGPALPTVSLSAVSRPTPVRTKALAPLRDPAFRRILAVAALLGAATIGDSFVFLLLQRGLDLAPGWFPLLPLGVAASYLLLAIPAGRIADRFGRRLPFLCGHLALLGGYVVLLTPLTPAAVVLVLVLLGVFYAATDGVLMALAGPVLPAVGRAGGLALLQTGQALTRLLGTAGFGAAWTLWGQRPALYAALTLLAVALTCGWALLRNPSHPERPTP
ncbi:MFS family permease [Kitasatospora gansuensis]|uniref:MFS family permease n=1 Tax=Kitasatospora gansuensis TaxID=258050 RepID=A0A7W7S6A9_9ACTN|nr:MFS transporter [Kitasatospora gansuensis]MBB4944690.1 MFS family permease [Kitasatospora gansuensis]